VYVYRWDLDKTYLHTEFDTWRDLVRTALQPAVAKQAIPGATPLLRALGREDRQPPARIYMLSGSPVQMREVLEEKLRLDGVRVDTLVLKDSLASLKRGRLRAFRGQFGYKLPRLLEARVGLGRAVRESLFGDDAEVDALVYSVYADAIAGRVRRDELARVLEAAGAYPDAVHLATESLRRVAHADAVDRIFIRLARGRPAAAFAPLGARVFPIRSWMEAALVLHTSEELDVADVEEVRRGCAAAPGELERAFSGVLQRGWASAERMEHLLTRVADDEGWQACRRELGRGGWRYVPPAAPAAVDYLDVLQSFPRNKG
jgi:hypothetical protein